jgi:hypothetical protein
MGSFLFPNLQYSIGCKRLTLGCPKLRRNLEEWLMILQTQAMLSAPAMSHLWSPINTHDD